MVSVENECQSYDWVHLSQKWGNDNKYVNKSQCDASIWMIMENNENFRITIVYVLCFIVLDHCSYCFILGCR